VRALLAILIGAPAGGLLGYLLGVYLACGLFDMGNLCGLVGVFVNGPLGVIGGGLAGWLLGRRTPAGP
jgi:hypothetical protein